MSPFNSTCPPSAGSELASVLSTLPFRRKVTTAFLSSFAPAKAGSTRLGNVTLPALLVLAWDNKFSMLKAGSPPPDEIPIWTSVIVAAAGV